MNDGINTFYKDKQGKIDETRLSTYGRKQLKLLQGAHLGFSDAILIVKGNKLIDNKGKVYEIINNDRLINKIQFKLITG